MQTKIIAEPKRLTFGLRRQLHTHRPQQAIYSARPIDELLYGNVSSLEILRQSYTGIICFSTDRLTYDLVDQLRAFKPNDGYHATGWQFVNDNLDLIVLDNAAKFSAERAVGFPELFTTPRTAYVRLPASPLVRLNSSRRFGLVFTRRLVKPAANHFLSRLAADWAIPRFNNKYEELRSRNIEIIGLNYMDFLLDDEHFSSTGTDRFIWLDLLHEAEAARQKIAEYNHLLGLAEDNFELFPFKPDLFFNARWFFSQPNRVRHVDAVHP
jgi:hypothetical protein